VSNTEPITEPIETVSPPAGLPVDVPAADISPADISPADIPPADIPPGDIPPADRGTLDIAERVVERIAARVAGEVDGVGAVPTSGMRRLLRRQDDEPTAAVALGSDSVEIELAVSVDYPRNIRIVTDAVRGRVTDEVVRLTGMTVEAVNISVPRLVTEAARPARPRVQ